MTRTLTDRWHPTLNPCPQYGTSHGYCYPCGCAYVSDTDGTHELALALTDAGYEVWIEQTGGFTMVVAGDLPTGGTIVANAEGIGVYAGTEWTEGNREELAAEWWATPEESERTTTGDYTAHLAAWTRLYHDTH